MTIGESVREKSADPAGPIAVAPVPATARKGMRVLVLDSVTHPAADRLEEEFQIVMRLSAPLSVEKMDALLLLCRPRLVLIKVPLDAVDPVLMACCMTRQVDLLVLARPTYGLLKPARLRRLGGLLWVHVRWPSGQPGCGRVKRFLDVALILAALPVLVPLMLVLLVVVGWHGPAFYFQSRVGEGGRPFRMIKFRTMGVDAEHGVGPQLATRDDRRVTAVGRYLRRTRLDELPQLWNVLRGEMSMVGPRPERPEFVSEFRSLPHYDLRHLIRPGLTGVAQLTGGYTATAEEKLRHDLLYLSYRSLRLDLTLLMLTLFDLVRGFPRG